MEIRLFKFREYKILHHILLGTYLLHLFDISPYFGGGNM